MGARYTEEEIKFLQDNRNLDRRELTRLFNKKFNQNRSVGTIYVLLHLRGLNRKTNRCTKEQSDFLRDNFELNRVELTRLFNKKFKQNKSVTSIMNWLHTHGLVKRNCLPFTDEQIDFLRDNHELNRIKLTQLFNKKFRQNRSLGSIRWCLTTRGFIIRKIKRYTDKQIDFLRDNIELSRVELTRLFNETFNENRTVSAIINQLHLKVYAKK
ncbi:MAG: hypothetical protein LBD41_03530 [Clostridiales Family XIII bacterium]|jgi:AraC-like DNA-binding protein|nr:hypothetical protein [Clostridiales Family XIII bacterium]